MHNFHHLVLLLYVPVSYSPFVLQVSHVTDRGGEVSSLLDPERGSVVGEVLLEGDSGTSNAIFADVDTSTSAAVDVSGVDVLGDIIY